MSWPEPSHRRSHVERDLVDADLDTAFALFYFAETQAMAGSQDEAYRALEEAEAACSDGQRRLQIISPDDDQSIRLRLQRMRDQIESMKLRLKSL